MKTKTHLPFIVLFTLLVTSAFSLYLPATAAETGDYEVTPCDVGACIVLDNPAGVSVRSGPGEEYSVITTLPYDPGGAVDLVIRGSVGEWMRVSSFSYDGNQTEEFRKTVGWIYAPPSLVVSAWPHGTPFASLYEEPNAASPVLTNLPEHAVAAVIGCRGEWVKVNYKGVKGWLAPGTHCGACITNCI
ncbi:MAG: SH3 domain-containing protein [Deltaproteobacteria bacterium]|nr:SH3 domain-containing protein [Candidatus Zymogenaceae bacterium]